jgi:hypothetical protein
MKRLTLNVVPTLAIPGFAPVDTSRITVHQVILLIVLRSALCRKTDTFFEGQRALPKKIRKKTLINKKKSINITTKARSTNYMVSPENTGLIS